MKTKTKQHTQKNKRQKRKYAKSNLNEGFSWKEKPICKAALDKLAQELKEWVIATHEIYLNRFWLAKGMTRDSFDGMLDRSDNLRQAYKFAKEMMGIKREEKIHRGEADRQTIAWRQPVYSQEVKEVEQWRSTLKEKEAKAGASNFIIEETPIPNSDIVPPKQKEEV